MTAADVLSVLDRLHAAGVEGWIDGGLGVDALLERDAAHDDLDFAIRAVDLARLPTIFPEFRRVDEDHWPAAYVLRDANGCQLDFHPLELDCLTAVPLASCTSGVGPLCAGSSTSVRLGGLRG